jgi:glucose/arabinose dehydrogenase
LFASDAMKCPPGRDQRAQDGALLVVHDRGGVVWRIALR